ncbi:MAG TPA: 2-oxoacid:ferredoxin oxidoreductase subunit beta [Anaerolineae bacterium]|jgi:2-oxoglutarate ferredoxin oxidoreductase subunit beta|nr:2-oxoacid:ferredoxin oxidoreductase subunit beta [Anaerolineae bacterium]
MTARSPRRENAIGLTRADYRGLPTTLCQGCGHNSISSQIIAVVHELNIRPQEILRLSGIGCSSKSPAYFLGQSHGFNSLHGRMPAVGTGALISNHKLLAIGVSGDGDTASIGMGQFKHLMRRNVRLVYIVENNGVYGLTKGQFSATADEGQELKYAGRNPFPPEDLCLEAIIAGCGFVARAFSGDPQQVRELLKAALSHRGTAMLDIISPCVTFNNRDTATKSYGWGKDHAERLHDLDYVPRDFVPRLDEIMLKDFEPGQQRLVELHDGSFIRLNKLDEEFDPTDRLDALRRLEIARQQNEFITGLIYFNPDRPSLAEVSDLGDTPLSELPEEKLRPSREALAALMREMQ